jgi:hypothetical protein
MRPVKVREGDCETAPSFQTQPDVWARDGILHRCASSRHQVDGRSPIPAGGNLSAGCRKCLPKIFLRDDKRPNRRYRSSREGAMTPDEKANENIKLLANWANTLATAIITVGTFAPIFQFLYGFLPATKDVLIYGTGLICLGAGLIIHLIGHFFLRSLR